MNFKFFLTLLFMYLGTTLHGQVTIGSAEKPVKGALLDLKEFDHYTTTGSLATANKGLLMPRLTLLDRTKLAPIIKDNNPELETERKNHVGLVVFHLGGNDMDAGLQVWDGKQWSPLSGSGGESNELSWFYMPGFPINVSKPTMEVVDLYQEYVKQFDRIPTGGYDIIPLEKLDFIIIGYDPQSFKSVTIDQDKKLRYEAYPAFIGAKSYLNIICQIKP